jgi:hypothetical protein
VKTRLLPKNKKIVQFLKEKLSAEIFINLAKVSKQWQFPVFFLPQNETVKICNILHFRKNAETAFSFLPYLLSFPVLLSEFNQG